MWTIYATPPVSPWTTGWDFRPDYFPRTVAGKAYAQQIADEAKKKGGTNVRVEKSKGKRS
jgi:Zn-dependent M28 family amino/carboxypeptidase